MVSDRDEQMAVDGGSGMPMVEMEATEASAVEAMAARLASDPVSDPVTGAELGMDEAGLTEEIAKGVKPD